VEFIPPGKIPFRKVRAKHPEVKELQDAILEYVQRVDARFAASYFQGIPINVPFPFRASAFPSTFSLGERFVPCDGRRIVNGDSPLNGQNAPVLGDSLNGAEILTWYIRIRD
jgi:hypothetical protein